MSTVNSKILIEKISHCDIQSVTLLVSGYVCRMWRCETIEETVENSQKSILGGTSVNW